MSAGSSHSERWSHGSPVRLLPRIAFFAAVLLASGTAFAASPSPVGTWTLDKAALDAAFQQQMQAALAKLPPDRRAKAEAMLAARPASAEDGPGATVEFRPDGTAVSTDGSGQRHTAHWTVEGDRIRGRGDEGENFVATLEGDTMRIRGERDGKPSRIEMVLHRQ